MCVAIHCYMIAELDEEENVMNIDYLSMCCFL